MSTARRGQYIARLTQGHGRPVIGLFPEGDGNRLRLFNLRHPGGSTEPVGGTGDLIAAARRRYPGVAMYGDALRKVARALDEVGWPRPEVAVAALRRRPQADLDAWSVTAYLRGLGSLVRADWPEGWPPGSDGFLSDGGDDRTTPPWPVFADWLEEQGDGGRAAVLRLLSV